MSTIIERDFAHELGRRIKTERKRLKLDQMEFGAVGGVGRATQYLYERGERLPSAGYLRAVMELGVDLRYLILGERSAKTGGRICLEPQTLVRALKIADELSRDEQGHLWDLERRIAITVELLKSIADSGPEQIDWEACRQHNSAKAG